MVYLVHRTHLAGEAMGDVFEVPGQSLDTRSWRVILIRNSKFTIGTTGGLEG